MDGRNDISSLGEPVGTLLVLGVPVGVPVGLPIGLIGISGDIDGTLFLGISGVLGISGDIDGT